MNAPGHLGEWAGIIDPELIAAVLEDTGVRTQRLRLLPARRAVLRAGPRLLRGMRQAVWAKLVARWRATA